MEVATIAKVVIFTGIAGTGVSLYYRDTETGRCMRSHDEAYRHPDYPDTRPIDNPNIGRPDDQYIPPTIKEQVDNMHPMKTFLNIFGFAWIWDDTPQFIKDGVNWILDVPDAIGRKAEQAAEWTADKIIEFLEGYFGAWFSRDMIYWMVFGVVAFGAGYATIKML